MQKGFTDILRHLQWESIEIVYILSFENQVTFQINLLGVNTEISEWNINENFYNSIGINFYLLSELLKYFFSVKFKLRTQLALAFQMLQQKDFLM